MLKDINENNIEDYLNISTEVRIWEVNCNINDKDLLKMYNLIKVLDYYENDEGIIKIGITTTENNETRDMVERVKGNCKKTIYQKPSKKKVSKKTFRNQMSFYVRVFDKKSIDKDSNNISEDLYNYEWIYEKKQTGFQFNLIEIEFEEDITKENNVLIESFTQKKSLKNYKIFDEKIESNKIIINDDKFYYSNHLSIKSSKKISKVNIVFIYEINMFLFTSGKIKISGGTNDNQAERAVNILFDNLNNYFGDEFKSIMNVERENISILDKKPVMINSDFECNYDINRFQMNKLIRHNYGLISQHESDSHPGVIIKYYCNDSYSDEDRLSNPGKCMCRKLYNKETFCDGKGDASEKGGCKAVTILIFQSGKIILTGGRLKSQVIQAYKFIKNVLDTSKELVIQKKND